MAKQQYVPLKLVVFDEGPTNMSEELWNKLIEWRDSNSNLTPEKVAKVRELLEGGRAVPHHLPVRK